MVNPEAITFSFHDTDMSQSIDTPHGPYSLEIPASREMAAAAEVLRDAVVTIAEGWRYGPRRDDAGKRHPDLVAYAHLSEAEKAYDRETARVVVAELLRRGLLRR